ncbi:MAG: ABC transporter substrate-binding protein [Desulfarculaceae bacterium]|jgi:NitT/TauT family transport system substrate-binding protein
MLTDRLPKYRRHLRIWVWSAALLIMVCPASAWAKQATKITVCLQWVHQAQFAGFYVAQDLGLYKQAGLEVTLVPGGPGASPLGKLASGKCDFAMAWLCDGIRQKSRGAPIVHLAQIIQRSALTLVAFGDSGIKTIKDMQGRKVGLWGDRFSLAPKALFKREGITVQQLRQGSSMAPFVLRALEVASAMRYNEIHQLYQAGIDLKDLVIFKFADLGLNFPEDGIYTTEANWQSRTQLCRRFVSATLQGWKTAFAKPEQTLKSVMKRVEGANLASNHSHQHWMLDTMSKLIPPRTEKTPWGKVNPNDLELVNKVLLSQGFIGAPLNAASFLREAWRAPK